MATSLPNDSRRNYYSVDRICGCSEQRFAMQERIL
jgi:hypothetical protein